MENVLITSVQVSGSSETRRVGFRRLRQDQVSHEPGSGRPAGIVAHLDLGEGEGNRSVGFSLEPDTWTDVIRTFSMWILKRLPACFHRLKYWTSTT